VEQTTRNSEVLHALRAEVAQLRADVAAARVDVNGTGMRVDVLAGDGAAIKAALAMHGRALDVLQQDVRQLRGDMTEVRDEITELRGETAGLRGEMNRRLSAIEQTVAAILAAVSPRDPA
jgi:predicted  nucleic acid-binding Zn-ribbon protein